MTRSRLSFAADLRRALRVLTAQGPFQSSPGYAKWKESLRSAETVIAAIDMIELSHPGLLHQLAAQAIEDYEAQQKPASEVTALIRRYARRVDP